MRPPWDLLSVSVWLSAAASLASAEPALLRDLCTRQGDSFKCSCSQQFPVFDVISSDTDFLENATDVAVRHCGVVKLPVHTLEKAAGSLRRLTVGGVGSLELDATLPRTTRELLLEDVGELRSLSSGLFQMVNVMDKVIMQNVSIKTDIGPYLLYGVTVVELRQIMFPHLENSALVIIGSKDVVVAKSDFQALEEGALMFENVSRVIISDNVFRSLANHSIDWKAVPGSQLEFRANKILAMEQDALQDVTGSCSFQDNLVHCAGDYTHCNQTVALSDCGPVCVVGDVCESRDREGLVEGAGCAANVPLTTKWCGLLVVPSVSAASTLRMAASVAAATLILLLTT